ncbi:MAG: EF-hand domain-containing protein [Afipia sp.]
MFFAAGAIGAAAVGALDILSSLTPDKSGAAKTGVKQTNSLFDLGTTASASTATITSARSAQAGTLSPSTFNALLSAQDANGKAIPSDALKDLFAQIDTNGDGKITKAEFEDKLGAGGTNIAAADNVFNKMDADSDGSVNLDEMATALKPKDADHHHAHRAGGGADALMEALQGASSTSTTNSDGSITTTLTYADGSRVTISQPASSSTSTSASTQYNLVERLVQRQADALAASAKQSVSVKV